MLPSRLFYLAIAISLCALAAAIRVDKQTLAYRIVWTVLLVLSGTCCLFIWCGMMGIQPHNGPKGLHKQGLFCRLHQPCC